MAAAAAARQRSRQLGDGGGGGGGGGGSLAAAWDWRQAAWRQQQDSAKAKWRRGGSTAMSSAAVEAVVRKDDKGGGGHSVEHFLIFKDPGHSCSLNKTGTLETSRLHMYSEYEVQQQEISEINMIEVPKEVLQVHGHAPPTKAEGTVRLIYENVNGFSNQLSRNEKVEKAKKIHNELEADIAAYCEHRFNMCHKKNCNGFNMVFKGGEADIRSIVAHNVHENIGRVQQGGTSLLLFGHLTKQLDQNKSGKDKTGLGRWSVMTLQGNGICTRIICGYNPCGNTSSTRGLLISSKGGTS